MTIYDKKLAEMKYSVQLFINIFKAKKEAITRCSNCSNLSCDSNLDERKY